MKKLSVFFAGVILFLAILNYPVEYSYGEDYHVVRSRIPLYAKTAGFFYRDWKYADIARKITAGRNSDDEKLTALFQWVHVNISSEIPEGLKIVDDHPLNIIIRGYGTDDQLADIFTILCCYAGFEAGYKKIWDTGKKKRIQVSFVKIAGNSFLFDVAGNYIFSDSQEKKIPLAELAGRKNSLRKGKHDYASFVDNIVSAGEADAVRGNMQKPLYRFLHVFW